MEETRSRPAVRPELLLLPDRYLLHRPGWSCWVLHGIELRAAYFLRPVHSGRNLSVR